MVAARTPRSSLRFGAATALGLAYALPLFHPPATTGLGVPTPADAWLLARIFPGVPALWVAGRLAALAGMAVLLAPLPMPGSNGAVGAADGRRAPTVARIGAVLLAALHAASALWAGGLGPLGQLTYLAMLAVPALLLTWGEGGGRTPAGAQWRDVVPTFAVIAAWVLARLVTDLGSPRTADVIDGWRAFLDIVRFVNERQNILTELYDPKLSGLGGELLFLHGVPFFQAQILPFSFRAVQLFQIAWVAVTAAGVALLAHRLVGAGTAALAAAVFLFAPFTRFMAFFPGPFLAAPFYAVALVLAALGAVRRRSEAGLAAFGAVAGLGLCYPSVVPLLGVVTAWMLWSLREQWRRLGAGLAAGLLSFAAVVVPAIPNILTPDRFGSHFRWDGLITVIEAGLLGQLPLRDAPPAYLNVVQRPLDVVVSALLAPFANPRVAVRLWGDALFDPLGAVLLVVGLMVAGRAARRGSWLARALVLTYFVALAPAFVSPIDVANVSYAVVLPVVVAVVAATGFAALGGLQSGRAVGAAAVVAVAVGGTVLFDGVNRLAVPASSFGIMFDVTAAAALDRVLVLGYGPDFARPTKTLYTGAITAFAGRQPVGYLEYDGGDLPVAEMADEHKDLLFWSHGYDRDVGVAGAVCAAWPDATFYEIWDRGHVARVHAARVGGGAWEPQAATDRWQTHRCAGR